MSGDPLWKGLATGARVDGRGPAPALLRLLVVLGAVPNALLPSFSQARPTTPGASSETDYADTHPGGGPLPSCPSEDPLWERGTHRALGHIVRIQVGQLPNPF